MPERSANVYFIDSNNINYHSMVRDTLIVKLKWRVNIEHKFRLKPLQHLASKSKSSREYEEDIKAAYYTLCGLHASELE